MARIAFIVLYLATAATTVVPFDYPDDYQYSEPQQIWLSPAEARELFIALFVLQQVDAGGDPVVGV